MQAEINVTPLVDVCLVLLIIFMVVTPMLTGVKVNLPESKTATTFEEKRQLPITVKEDATLYVDSTVIRRDQLAGELERLHTQHPERPVLVRGDARVKYGEVVDVLGACRAVGFHDVGLASSQPTPAVAAMRRSASPGRRSAPI